MPWIYIAFLLLGAFVAWLSYIYLRRAVKAFGASPQRPYLKLILWGSAALIGVCALIFQRFFVPFLFHFFLFALILQLGNFIFKRITRKRYEKGFSLWKKLHASSLLPLLLTAVFLIYGYVNLHTVVATHYTVYTEKAIREEGYRAVFVSDVHYGVSLDREELQKVCEEIEAQKPSLVILGGDIIDHETGNARTREVFELFGSINSEFGTFFSFGNHDRPMRGLPSEYSGQYGEEALLGILEECGITVLRDGFLRFEGGLTLVCREDRHADERKSIATLLSETDQADFILTIDHQPIEYKENARAGTNLLLSGHTHGGQFFPLQYVMTFFGNDAVYGRTTLDTDTTAIVSSGLACWGYPYKTAAPAEYLVIDILPTK